MAATPTASTQQQKLSLGGDQIALMGLELILLLVTVQGPWPAPRCSHAAAAVGSKLIMQGGSFYRYVARLQLGTISMPCASTTAAVCIEQLHQIRA